MKPSCRDVVLAQSEILQAIQDGTFRKSPDEKLHAALGLIITERVLNERIRHAIALRVSSPPGDGGPSP
jgi:hypothetical protein